MAAVPSPLTPAVLSRLGEPFDRAGWIFELEYDGFRGLALIEEDRCRLVSRNGYTFKSWPGLCDSLASTLRGHSAVLDGEIVALDGQGRPQFNALLYRQADSYYATFDCLWLDGRDLRQKPLIERKRVLRNLVPGRAERIFYVRHVEKHGVNLFRAVCDQDLEGIVAKLASVPTARSRRVGSRSRTGRTPRRLAAGSTSSEGSVKLLRCD